MKVKTSELTDQALDWAVAVSERYEVAVAVSGDIVIRLNAVNYFDPSKNWGWAGPIIWREGILNGPSPFPAGEFAACMGSDWDTGRFIQIGPTPLVAAMRCYVASRLGDEIEIPDELVSERLLKNEQQDAGPATPQSN